MRRFATRGRGWYITLLRACRPAGPTEGRFGAMAKDVPEKLRRKIERFPRKPGVYLMKDAGKEVIYVGKAKDLRARVRSYFGPVGDDRRLIREKFGLVADVDFVVTGSEKEALLLESNFVKQFRPKYNVVFRDDKSFVSIRINPGEPWPRPVITRRLDEPGALYFGPYASARAARRTLRVLQDVFPLRRCSLAVCRRRRRPCIYGEMGKCLAPCCAEVSEEEYGRHVEQVILFLEGRGGAVIERLRRQMEGASASLEFEKAARIRDRIAAVEQTLETQRVASSGADYVDRDVFGACASDRHVTVAVLFIRGGNMRDAATYRFPARLGSEATIFGSFLNQFYRSSGFVPREVLLPMPTEDAHVLADWLSEKRGRKVRVIRPQRGRKKRLVELAERNARQAEHAATSAAEKRRLEMESLRSALGLRRLPRRIECFDISTLSGREAVGSMVVFEGGEPDRSAYRRYRIREVAGQDDFAMMREVLGRRYGGADPEGLPDLVLVDGGRGQLRVALDVLGEAGIDSREVAALAKARSAGGRRLKQERVYLPGRSQPLPVPEGSHAYHLITRVRDEAHRFAVAYHRKVRRRAALESPLEEIRGVGRTLAVRLLEHFGGLNKVRAAGVEELRAVRGISEALARAIRRHYHPDDA